MPRPLSSTVIESSLWIQTLIVSAKDRVREADDRLVDRVVDDLVDQVVQSRGSRRADVHGRALPHRRQALEHLDGTGIVFAQSSPFEAHRSRAEPAFRQSAPE
jgi:hypothetical protein